MVFDINRMMKRCSFWWLDWDGNAFVKGRRVIRAYIWAMFVWVLLIYDVFRFTTLAVIPPDHHSDPPIEFYLVDYCNGVHGRPYRAMILIGVNIPLFHYLFGEIYNFWTCCLKYLFEKMQFDKRYRTWLTYLQVPMTRTADDVKLVGYNKSKLIKFWERGNKLQSFFFVWCLIQSIFVMSCSATSYAIIVSHKYRHLFSPEFFWTLLVINYISLVVDGTMCLLIEILPIVHLYLITSMFGERFQSITQKLAKYTHGRKKINPPQIDRHLQEFNIIIDELHKCNFFWQKVMALNYHYSLILCCINLLVGLFTDDVYMILFASILFMMTYSPLIACCISSGELHTKIQKVYAPLTNLMANRQLKYPTTIRIVRLLGFINSEHSGITCSDFFLIRKETTLHVLLELVANTILLYDYINYLNFFNNSN